MPNHVQDRSREYDFGFDPKSTDWDDYFHIPGVVKYLCD
jgi:fatty acyl-CoA reductase